MYQHLLTDLEKGMLTITINRPEKLNALNREVIAELSLVIDEVYENNAVQSAIITGAGTKAFVAGADISEFTQLDEAAGIAMASKGQAMVFDKIENAPKPILAAVNGFALGGGCELAMACHLRIASEQAKFGQPEINLGLIPGYGGTQRLVHLIGKGKAMELLLTGNMINAASALQLGLVNEVTSAEALLDAAKAMLLLIQTKAPLAISQCIALVNKATYEPQAGLKAEIAAFGSLMNSADAKEGATAFLEKRKPAFLGK